jgi:hypothetical protein
VARVHLPELVDPLVGGERRLEIDAEDYRGLMAALEARFPGLTDVLERDHAVVIDGDIIDQPLLEAVAPDSEIHFIARLGGG